MALPSDLETLRRFIDELDESTYSDTELSSRLAVSGATTNSVARDIWGEKMSAASSMVNVSEGGSSRSMAQVFDHAKAMRDHYAALVLEFTQPAPVLRKLTRL